jgi:tetratricopeptide (TPR) repeat protein
LAKKLHPDHRAGLKIQDPDRVFDDLYLAIKAAYEVLSSDTERRRYDFSLEKTRPHNQPAPEPPPAGNTSTRPNSKNAAPTGPPPSHYDAGQMARLHFANGQRFFNDGNYHEAIEELQDAVRLDGGRAEYHRLLGNALVKNPKWRRRAEACFLRVLELDRFDIDTMIALGEIYESGGMERRAKKMYEEALGLDPGNPRAIEKLGGGSSSNTMDKLKGILHRSKGH